MTDIQAPDGTIARFPDGMSDEAITAVMRQHYPAPTGAVPAQSSPLGGAMPTAADLAAKGYGAQPGIGAELGSLNNVVRSLASGATLGGADRLAAAAGAATGIGGTKGDYAGNLANEQQQTAQFQGQHPIVSAAANMAGTGAGLATLPLAEPVTALGRLLAGAGTGAAVGGIQGATSSPDLTNTADTLERAKEGAETGAVLGGGLPAAGSMLGRLITPLPVGLPRATNAAFVQQAGIPLSAGQISGNKPLRVLESVLSEMPFSGGGAQKLEASQNQALTSALLARAAITGDRADTDTVNEGFGSLSDAYRALSAGRTMGLDPQLESDARDALHTYQGKVSAANQASLPAELVNDLFPPPEEDAPPQASAIPGEAYQAQRSSLTNDAHSMKYSDPQQADFYRSLRNAMDAAMARSNPGDAQAWAATNRNWGNLKDIAKAAAGAGVNAAEGIISPQKMRQVLAGGNNAIGYARGKGDFNDLIHAANAVMTPFPNSGTAGRINAMHMISMLGGGGLGAMEAGVPGAGTALLGALAGPALAGRALMSRPVQSYLGNQVLPAGINVPTLGSAMAAALAQQGR